MSMIVSSCQHCDEQQFQLLSCVHYSIFSVVKLDLFIRALKRDHTLALRTPRVNFVLYVGGLFVFMGGGPFLDLPPPHTKIFAVAHTYGHCLSHMLALMLCKSLDY